MLNEEEHIFFSPKVIGQAKLNTLAYHIITLFKIQLYLIAQATIQSLSFANELFVDNCKNVKFVKKNACKFLTYL
jgi:hypothetical protein